MKFNKKARHKSQVPKKLNAFEMHVNRKKFDVLGMKSKAEKGLPGISRSKAIKKRKATLLQEYKIRNKINTFVDRRIGEKNNAMTAEDKIMARFTAERIKFHSKKSIFNLGESEELTHRGESLTEIEKYDDPKSDDEFDNENDGILNKDFVGDAHFGGGILKKSDGESKTRKDLIDQLIAESKKRKAEKHKLRAETLDLTKALDSKWKELLPLVTNANKRGSDTIEDIKKDKKSASYDILSKQLMFEARGKPLDKLKSEEEIAKEEKDKLEAMEKDRINRMLGENRKPTIKHRSADDLDDGFELNSDSESVLQYKDGVANVQTVNRDESLLNEENHLQKNEDSEADSEEEDENCNDEGSDIESEYGPDNLSDLKESDNSDTDVAEDAEPRENKLLETSCTINKGNDAHAQENEHSDSEDIDGKEKIEIEKKLPFTFEIPHDFKSYKKLMYGSDLFTQSIILERMLKCNHPSLNSSNKEKLYTLFTFLLQHLQDSTASTSAKVNCFQVLESISPFLFDLVHWNPESCSFAIIEVITEKYNNFKKLKRIYPSLDTLVFFKLVNLLFSTSDYRHSVATPTMLFMQEILSSCRIVSSTDVSSGLFISTLIVEFCSFSKRYVPEVINFIKGVLRLSHPKEFHILPLAPFKLQNMESFNLNIQDKTRMYDIEKMTVADLVKIDNSEGFKVKSIALSLRILSELCDFFCNNPAAFLIFETFIPLLDSKNFCICHKNSVEEILSKILAMKSRPLNRLVRERKRPKALRLYEPRMEEVYSLKKHLPMGKEKQERAKLRHKYKREMKGALREIRRDNSFLAKLKMKEIRKSDLERQRKVKEILGSVADQTGEVRKLKKKK